MGGLKQIGNMPFGKKKKKKKNLMNFKRASGFMSSTMLHIVDAKKIHRWEKMELHAVRTQPNTRAKCFVVATTMHNTLVIFYKKPL